MERGGCYTTTQCWDQHTEAAQRTESCLHIQSISPDGWLTSLDQVACYISASILEHSQSANQLEKVRVVC